MITVTGTCENYIAEMTADRGTLNATHCDIPVEQGGQNAYMRPRRDPALRSGRLHEHHRPEVSEPGRPWTMRASPSRRRWHGKTASPRSAPSWRSTAP